MQYTLCVLRKIKRKLPARHLVKEFQEKQLLEKFQGVLKMANHVKVADVSSYLGLTSKELFEKLVKWGEFLPFKLEEDVLVVNDLQAFTAALNAEFAKWSSTETIKDNKI